MFARVRVQAEVLDAMEVAAAEAAASSANDHYCNCESSQPRQDKWAGDGFSPPWCYDWVRPVGQ